MIGPGLLGGSILKATRKFLPKCEIRIWARRLQVLESSEVREYSDFADTDIAKVVSGADLIVLAMPIQHMAQVVKTFPPLKGGTLVTDVGSTKLGVVQTITPLVHDLGGAFIGSHPMAGSEKTGIDHSTEELFSGAAVILTPSDPDEANVERLSQFWQALGAKVSMLSPERHDEVVASVSHLPHLLASALVRCVLGKGADENLSLTGGGFRDTTRIAAGDPDMWTEIMMDNQIALLGEVGAMIDELTEWKEALSTLDKDLLHRFLSEAKECREKV